MPSFRHLKVGDKVTRMWGGHIEAMPMTVMHVDDDLLYCAAPGTEGWTKDALWTFHRDAGCEEDADLEWGKAFGRTGSYLKEEM